MSEFRQGRGRRYQSIHFDPEDRLSDQLDALARSLPRLSQRERDLAVRLLNEAEKHHLSRKQLQLVRQLSAGCQRRRRYIPKPTKKKFKSIAIRDAQMAAYRARVAAPWRIFIRDEKGGAD